MPVKIRGHVLSMTTEANDAFWLSLYGLQKYASAAALGPIRNVAETLAWISWLLEDADDDVRRARSDLRQADLGGGHICARLFHQQWHTSHDLQGTADGYSVGAASFLLAVVRGGGASTTRGRR